MKKYSIIALIILLLVGCSKASAVPQEDTQEPQAFPDSIRTSEVLEEVHINALRDTAYTYYLASSKSGNVFEGNAFYDVSSKQLRLTLTLSAGESCTGTLDGPKIDILVDLEKETLINKELSVWKGCDGDQEIEPDLNDQQLIDLAFAVYTSLKDFELNS